MKFLPSFCLLAALSVSSSLAGSMGGPAPFRNGSPLASGTDGTYNATISGDNLSGVMRFSISSGSQAGAILNPQSVTPGTDPLSPTANTAVAAYAYSTRQNNWVAWFEGKVYRGITDASITENSVSGVLDVMMPLASQAQQPESKVMGNTVIQTSTGAATTVNDWQSLFATGATDPQYNYTGYGPNNINPAGLGTAGATTVFSQNGSVAIAETIVPVEMEPAINSTVQGGTFAGTIAQNNPNGTIQGNGYFVIVRNKGTVTGAGGTYATKGGNDPQFVASQVEFKWKGARVNLTGSGTDVNFTTVTP